MEVSREALAAVTLAREWMRQDNAYDVVRHLVAIDGPNHDIVDCSPPPLNYFALTTERKGPTKYLVIRNADTSFVYFSAQDGFFAALPALDRDGNPHDFSQSAKLRGAKEIDLTDEGDDG
jgi:hypothetical protein